MVWKKKKKMKNLRAHKRGERGFSLPELVIVLLILAILVVLALPHVISSRRLFRFTGMERQIVSALTDARQEAMSQRTPVTFRYDDSNKQIKIYGGSFGALGDARNRVAELTDSGLEKSDLVYGRPGGAPNSALSDGSNMTSLTAKMVDITFQPDGSVIDAANNPSTTALFLYHKKYPNDMAFAVSVLGAGGRVKLWRYSKGAKIYVE